MQNLHTFEGGCQAWHTGMCASSLTSVPNVAELLRLSSSNHSDAILAAFVQQS